MAEFTTKRQEKLDLTKIDFFGLLAHTAEDMKETLIMSLIPLIGKGDPAALRLLETAFKLATPVDEKNKPIPILGGITQTQNVVQGNDGAPQNSNA